LFGSPYLLNYIPELPSYALAYECYPGAETAMVRAIFGEIRQRLKPGGWYLNYDPVRAPDPILESIWERVNDRYDPDGPYKRTHRTEQEQARYENHVRFMIPLEPQLQWLREAGFTDIDVFWKRLDR